MQNYVSFLSNRIHFVIADQNMLLRKEFLEAKPCASKSDKTHTLQLCVKHITNQDGYSGHEDVNPGKKNMHPPPLYSHQTIRDHFTPATEPTATKVKA